MESRIDYRVPTLLMAMMLACILYLVVWYPAKHFDLSRPQNNPELSVTGGDYKLRKDYTDLEWYGRTIYIQEGCFYCHSQQARYQDRGMGPTAIPQEYQYDAPHLLGSERTGPDLSREGGKYPSRWHIMHHINPRSKSAGSIMPSFKHLEEEPLTFDVTESIDAEALLKMSPAELREALKAKGGTETDRRLTPEETVLELRAIGYTDYDLRRYDGRGVTRMDALVAYIQSLGPGRMYEPGDPVRAVEPVPVATDDTYELGRWAAGTGQGARAAVPREPLPADLPAPGAWHRLAEREATYWVPTEYQDLAAEAKAENKIPAFEPRFINNGRGIYLGKCAHCHGLNGQGNGPTGRYMMKKPANFWLPQYKLYSDAMWFYRIAEGVPGTEMPVWKLSLRQRKKAQRWDQIWYLVTYLKYIAQMSPMEPVPYDLPSAYYLVDPTRAQLSIVPVDTLWVSEYRAREEAAASAEAGR